MSSLRMYCIDLYNEDYNKIKSLEYLPVGLGADTFKNEWLRDNTGENISKKNSSYGELTFHYWLWKNKLNEINDNEWIGFCAYRRFWAQHSNSKKIENKKDFLNYLPNEWKEDSVILGQEIHMDGWTTMKLLKHGFKSIIKNPKLLIKKNRNLKFHFDSFHGYGKLDKAIELLDESDKKDFKKFMENKNSYNRGNMFICKSKKIIKSYYKSIFPWLARCEKIFNDDVNSSNDYGEKRIYAFLAERYMSYWFNKYSKVITWPIIFYNLNQNDID